MSPETTLSDAEYLVLQVLWDLRSATVREIRNVLVERGQEWAPTTVNTLLTRLENKQFVATDRSEFAHRFHPLIGRESLVRQRLQDVADTYCNGQKSPLLLALVDSQSLSSAEVQQLRELLDKLDQQNRSPTRKSPAAKRGTKKRRPAE